VARILVAEADVAAARRVCDLLAADGHVAEHVRTGQAALAVHARADLLIAAADLPGLDGVEVTQRLRSAGHWLPVILTAAEADAAERVIGLEAGADDFVSGRLKPRELLARVRAVLRRCEARDDALRLGDLSLEPHQFTAHTREGQLDLRPQEFRLLKALASQPGRVLSRQRLVQLAWDRRVDPATVDVHVSRVRGKLRGSDVKIENVWGRGYRLVSSERPAASSPDTRCRSA
jgi:two-component system response regulator BaeR